MAPIKKLRTYQNTTFRTFTKSESVFNDLLAKNLTKRFEYSLNKSSEKSLETTFDRLLKGKTYNNVAFKKFPENRISDDENTSSVSHTRNATDFDDRTINSIISNEQLQQDNAISIDHSKNSCVNPEILKPETFRSPIFTRSKSRSLSNCSDSTYMRRDRSDVKQLGKSAYLDRLHRSCNNSLPSTSFNCDRIISNEPNHELKKQAEILPGFNKKSSNSNSSDYSKFEHSIGKNSTPLLPQVSKITKRPRKFKRIIAIPVESTNESLQSSNQDHVPSSIEAQVKNSALDCKNNSFSDPKAAGNTSLVTEDVSTVSTKDDYSPTKNCNISASESYSLQDMGSSKIPTPIAINVEKENLLETNSSREKSESNENEYPEKNLAASIPTKNHKNILLKKHKQNFSSILCAISTIEENEISEFKQFENSISQHLSTSKADNFKHPVLIASTPLNNTKRSPAMARVSSVHEETRNKSYEIIERWNYKCPSPDSFTIKKLGISGRSRRISKKNRLGILMRFKDIKLRGRPIVVLNRFPELEKIVKNKDRSKNRNLTLSHKFVTTRKANKKIRYNAFKTSKLKYPIVLLTPFKSSSSKTKIEGDKIPTPLEFNKHVCSKDCECFRREPKVLLTRLDALMFGGSLQENRDSETVIDLTDSVSEHDVHSNHPMDSSLSQSQLLKNREFKNMKDCYVLLTPSLSKKQLVSRNLRRDSIISVLSSEISDNEGVTTPEQRSYSFHRNQTEGRSSDRNRIERCPNQIERSEEKRSSSHSRRGRYECRTSFNSNEIIETSEVGQEPMNRTTEMSNCRNMEVSRVPSSPVTNLNLDESEDIIESSIGDLPTLPRFMKKYVRLPQGKKYRRSMSIFKRAKESLDISGGSTRHEEKSVNFKKKLSVKLVAVTPVKGRLSDLESYALRNEGYASRRESHLEDIENNFPNLYISINDNDSAKFIEQAVNHYTARDIVLRRCDQTEPLSFEKCYPPSALQHCQKIGEGVYGEVFMFRDKDGSTTVMKIIPIEGDQIVNLEKQKTFKEILSEIIISMELTNLRNIKRNNTDAFTEVKNIRCVQGIYPDRLLELWELYDENKNSENDSPELFHDDQLYIVLELSNGGCDLEAFQFKNSQQSLAVFKQIACALAVAENELQFEHRDLHWGNVLVKNAEEKNSVFVLDGKEIVVDNKDAKATIIDFTLSRIEHEGVVIFNDLAMDEDLFSAKGDYQFEIYRLMQKSNGNEWQTFKPYSNILWLHYILDKAITAFHYRNVKSKLHRSSLATLETYKNEILDYQSVTDFVLNNFVQIV